MASIKPHSIGEQTSRSPRRVGWIDASRGLIIVIIACYHASLKLIASGINAKPVMDAIAPLSSTGMALFFIIAGMNSKKYVNGTWRFTWRRRLGPLIWLLLIWTLIDWLFYEVIFTERPLDDAGFVALRLLFAIATPSWGLWFLWSLTLYSAVSKLISNVPKNVVSSITGLVAVIGLCTSDWHMRKYGLAWFADNYNARSAISYFAFFYIGHTYSAIVLRIASAPLLPSIVLASIIVGIIRLIDLNIKSIIFSVPIGIVSLILSIFIAIMIGRCLAAFKIFCVLGAATLPIYVMHDLIIEMLLRVHLVKYYAAGASSYAPALMLGPVSVLLALGAALALGRKGVTWLFKPPEVLVSAHDRAIDRFVRA